MSQMTATVRATPRPTRATTTAKRPALRVVDAAPKSGLHIGMGAIIALMIVTSFIAALLLNTLRAEGSFDLSALQSENARLHATQVSLEAEVSQLQSPATLAERAEDLGMVSSPSTAVLRLSDSAVVGVAAGVVDGKTYTVQMSAPAADDGAVSADEDAVAGE
ncbi:septum formation initiator family protein [Ornithinimicrobium sp. INDO-MA30-4]|uniref:FtsB family cell division protein n=1 Tax=Ornithinimicrobium sp. INDO-MA30-4 TaxID=2908651 RepID=UPI001F2030F7|nr:septum formation initiator family protein [Ornithinimicrobium sp. INDO-MA30-4]UJH71346.1 septum formation initiator family protein [Ornithinimicrobium sp. INDO-MA30-4]